MNQIVPQTTETQETSMLAIINNAVQSKDVDVQKMRELFELQKDFMKEKAQREFAVAMMECQKEIAPVYRESQNPDNKSRFAKLEKLDAAIRPIYTKHGFSLSFGTKSPDIPGNLKVTCRCTHISGHFQDFELEGALDVAGPKGGATKTAIQGAGSTVSYLRRYLTGMIFNVVYTNEDNDGAPQSQFITPTQRSALITALGGEGSERVTAFCTRYGLADVSELGADQFDKAMAIARKA